MVARSLDVIDPGVSAIRSAADARAHACKHRLRYRVAIVAPTVVDAVRSAGGWILDRVMAGWEVTVMVPDLGDPAPLQILGAIVLNLEDALGSPADAIRIWPDELVVAATVLESDARIRDSVTANLEAHADEIMFWGDGADESDGRVRGVEHRLSAAARAFKARALVLAGESPESVPSVEIFHRRGPLSGCVAELVQLSSWPRRAGRALDRIGSDVEPNRGGDAVIIDIARGHRSVR
ncbi:hypothetical protein [Nocardia miyunensis]|uniref:hypothetical protein n=1 Tax=Nocardia miyunensis TaxID=282684 RepID=UPI0008316640|nr:hypothetical protein [Nocardia miyunensis]